jgi:hypothetical protein
MVILVSMVYMGILVSLAYMGILSVWHIFQHIYKMCEVGYVSENEPSLFLHIFSCKLIYMVNNPSWFSSFHLSLSSVFLFPSLFLSGWPSLVL